MIVSTLRYSTPLSSDLEIFDAVEFAGLIKPNLLVELLDLFQRDAADGAERENETSADHKGGCGDYYLRNFRHLMTPLPAYRSVRRKLVRARPSRPNFRAKLLDGRNPALELRCAG